MKNFNTSFYQPSIRPGQPDIMIYNHSQTVEIQRQSPVINGRLVYIANPLRYGRRLYKSTPGMEQWPYQWPSDLQAYLPWYDSYYLGQLSEQARIEVTNKWVLKTQAFGTNMIEIYRTRKETIDMVTSTVRRLTSAYHAMRHKNWRHVSNILGISYRIPRKKNHNNPPALWLEYTYGWAPLVSDAYLLLNKPFPELRHRVASGKDFTVQVSDDASSYSYTSEIAIRIRCVGEIFVNDSTVKAISYYGIDNPSLAIWEAMPYSFVVDWFSGIGEYLQSLSAFNGIGVRNYSASTSYNIKSSSVTKRNPVLWDYRPGSSEATQNICDRLTGVPSYTFRPVTVDIGLNRFASALSLMAQAFSRRL